MEFIILVFLVFFIIGLFTKAENQNNTTTTSGGNNSNNYNSNETSQKNYNYFNIEIKKNIVQNLNTLDVSMKGKISFKYYKNIAIFKVELNDVTTGKEIPIVCQYEDFSASDAPIFQYITKPINIDAKDIEYKTNTKLISIPVDILTFPHKGSRAIESRVSVYAANSSGELELITSNKNRINHFVDYIGYLERKSFVREFNKNLTLLSLELAYSDGKIDQIEIDYIKKQLVNKIYKFDQKSENEELTRLIDEKSVKIPLYNGTVIDRVKTLCNKMKEHSDEKLRMEGLKFLINLSSVDNKVHENEFYVLETISKIFEISEKKFNDLKIKILPPNISDNETSSTDYLELHKYPTIEAKKKHLRDLYRKWNPLVTHSDIALRKKAEYIILLISKERSKLNANT